MPNLHPVYLIQIVEAKTGRVVRFPGGGRPPYEGSLERNVIEVFTKHILARPELATNPALAIGQGVEAAIDELKRLTERL